jgi:hypothetical protein
VRPGCIADVKGRIAGILFTVLVAAACSAFTPPTPIPSASGAIDGSAALRRPLQFPHLDRGESCPRSEWKPLTDLNAPPELGTTGYIVLGSGPAYPIVYNFDTASGALSFRSFVYQSFYPRVTPTVPPSATLRWDKVRWIVAAEYQGPLLVRGVRLDAPGAVTFHELDHPLEIQLASPSTSPAEWRDYPGALSVEGPGCYGFQLDGADFTKTVVLQVAP